jgi:hypothetical protein
MNGVTFSVQTCRDQWVVRVQVDGVTEGYRIFRNEFAAYKFIHRYKDR